MWDLATDPDTGDFLFGPTFDLIAATGPQLVEQRILSRCKIPRGTFTYDDDGNLGSRLHLISRTRSEQQLAQAIPFIQEALDGMEGVSIGAITPSVVEGQLLFRVRWSPISEPDEAGEEPEEELPEFDVDVIITE
jgi:hypothetical protein